jgi:hypothetical protein
MAKEEQLAILKDKGVTEWNKWRKKNRDHKPDLSGADLIEEYLNVHGEHWEHHER